MCVQDVQCVEIVLCVQFRKSVHQLWTLWNVDNAWETTKQGRQFPTEGPTGPPPPPPLHLTSVDIFQLFFEHFWGEASPQKGVLKM